MNYYEHHLGDYLRDTAHLSMLEDGAYRRLLDAYYIRETPLPLVMRDVFRLVRATTKQDREAVETVLQEFFTETPEGWRHSRCDREIDRFQDKQRKARASAEARWSQRQPHTERNANASTDAMRTHSEGNAPRARPQTPDTRHQTKKTSAEVSPPPPARPPEADPPEANGQPPTAAGIVCRAMRQAGLAAVNPGDPRLLALLEQGATEAEFVGIAAEAAGKGKGWAWVLTVLQARRSEAGQIALTPKPDDPMAWRRTSDGVFAMAKQLAVESRPDELFHDFERRVLSAFQRADRRQTSAA